MLTREKTKSGPIVTIHRSLDTFHKQVERYFKDINIQIYGSSDLTENDKRCSRDAEVIEMCLCNVMTLDLRWRADISLEDWIHNVQAIWREEDRDHNFEKFDIVKSIAVLSRHFKDHLNKQIDLVSNERTYNWEGYIFIRDFVNRGIQIIDFFDLIKEAIAIEALKMKQGRRSIPSINLIWPSVKSPNPTPDPPPYSLNPPARCKALDKLKHKLNPKFESDVSRVENRQTRWPSLPFN